MAFTAMDVKALREKTGVGMMDCKKALTEADGDMDKAIDFLRERGLAAAEKKSARIAAEGVVYTYYDEAAKKAALKKAADIYGQIAEKFDYAAVYALFKQANFYHAINPDLKVGLALPYYKKLIDKIDEARIVLPKRYTQSGRLRLAPPPPSGIEMFRCENLFFSYDGVRNVLHDVT